MPLTEDAARQIAEKAVRTGRTTEIKSLGGRIDPDAAIIASVATALIELEHSLSTAAETKQIQAIQAREQVLADERARLTAIVTARAKSVARDKKVTAAMILDEMLKDWLVA